MVKDVSVSSTIQYWSSIMIGTDIGQRTKAKVATDNARLSNNLIPSACIKTNLESERCSFVPAVQTLPSHNMPRSVTQQKVQFSMIEINRKAVRLVLIDFPGILIFNGRRGHAWWEPYSAKAKTLNMLPTVATAFSVAQLAHVFEILSQCMLLVRYSENRFFVLV